MLEPMYMPIERGETRIFADDRPLVSIDILIRGRDKHDAWNHTFTVANNRHTADAKVREYAETLARDSGWTVVDAWWRPTPLAWNEVGLT